MIALITRYWKRRIAKRPDFYRAYLTLPTETSFGRERLADIGRCAYAFEPLCDGRLDVYGTRKGYVVDTDDIPTDQFDVDEFDRLVRTVRDLYPEPYVLRTIEKWVARGRDVGKAYLVEPVKPLLSNRPEPTRPREQTS